MPITPAAYDSHLWVKEPLDKLLDDWDLFEDTIIKKFWMFRRPKDSQNMYNAFPMDVREDAVINPLAQEAVTARFMTPDGVGEATFTGLQLHMAPAGTPHQLPHMFGYWHINDMDELVIGLPNPAPGQPGVLSVCQGEPSPGDVDRFVWYCEKCLTMLFERVSPTGDLGWQRSFWHAEIVNVREYNSDVKNRTCPECGHVNPLGYTFYPNKDTPEQAAARKQW